MILPFYRWGLGAKFSLALFVVVCGVALTISISVIKIGERAMTEELRERGAAAVRILSKSSAELVMREQLWELYEITKIMTRGNASEKNILTYAMVIDRYGVLLSHSDPVRFKIGSSLASDPIYTKVVNSKDVQIVGTYGLDGEPVLDVSSPVILDGQRIGTVRVGVTRRYMRNAIKKEGIAVIFISTMLALCGVSGGLLIARRMTKPLKELDANMKALSEGLPIEDKVVVLKEKDEIGRLADTFNLMAITLKEKERELVKSERLASIGEFAAGLAHEIRNPIGSVVTAVNILSSGKANSQEIASLNGVVKKESDRLNRILSDFLIFARPTPPKLRDVELNEILKETVEMVKRHDSFAEGILIELDLDKEIKNVRMDPDQMRQVFWNMLLNSIEAMGGSGALAISSKAMAGKAIISIKDTGHGIEDKELERIFEPFYTTKQNGTGLGLSIVNRIVETHGGKIFLYSKAGEGTTFILEFPVQEGLYGFNIHSR